MHHRCHPGVPALLLQLQLTGSHNLVGMPSFGSDLTIVRRPIRLEAFSVLLFFIPSHQSDLLKIFLDSSLYLMGRSILFQL